MSKYKIFYLMEQKGVTYTALSEATGISIGNISDWKNRKSSPSVAALIKLADYFNVSLDYLVGRTTEINSETKYIDAQKLIKDFEEDINNANQMSYSDTIEIMQRQPAADVSEVRQGRNATKMNPVDEFVCSECGIVIQDMTTYDVDDEVYQEYTPNYCPHCGAKMMEE